MNKQTFTPQPQPEEGLSLESLARRRARAKLGWMVHAAVYVGVNLLLAGLAAHQGKAWAVYPALGWGIGLLVHGADVWLRSPFNGLYAVLVERERQGLERSRATSANH